MRALSIDARYRVVRNLVSNPSFEVNTAGWYSISCTFNRDTSWSKSGVASLKLSSPNSASSDVRAGTAASFPFGLPNMSGQTLRLAATGRLVAPITVADPRGLCVSIYWSTNGSTYSAPARSSAIPNAAGSSQVSVSVTLPTGLTGMLLMLGLGSSTAADAIWWDAVMLTEGPTLYDYADGDSPSWQWDGTPGASTSRGWVFVP